MQKQAKHLIDDLRFNLCGVATGWDYDDRVNCDNDTPFPMRLRDNKSGYGVRVKRDFQAQTSGKMVLEMLYITHKSADGVSLKMCSSKDEVLFEYTTENGKYYFNGNATDCDSTLGITRVKLWIDLDNKTVKFAVEGKTVCTYPLGAFCDASKLILGTTGKTDIEIEPTKNKLYIDYIANESFLGTVTEFPEPWKLDGSFTLDSYYGENEWKAYYAYAKVQAKAGEKHTALLPVDRTEENVICEGYFLLPEGADGLKFALVDGEKEYFSVVTDNCSFMAPDGTLLRKFTPNVWQLIRFETEGDKVLVKIDGKVCGTFEVNGKGFDGILVSLDAKADCTMCFSDILCESKIEYPDYCPEPKAVRHPVYDVGMNICNMWREGHHFGWDRITYFKDNMPLIGPYDEGSAEVADWEIKFMTEHGITFQHFCWYCPDPTINFPLKRSRMDHALRDGFMNARYSDKMKFIIMWENATYKNTNPDEFIEYIWKYWCDYFFSDPRYLVVDNRPLICIWTFSFIEHWGGPEKAKKVIEFMNEDIKRLGFDGVYLMTTFNNGQFRMLSEYSDISYSYHFGALGYNPDHQKATINIANRYHDEEGLMPYMQTASVGYNDCAWRGPDKRVPLITPDGFEDVLRFIKKRNDDIKDKKWHDKLFMMSTWNEYGEGTYIMPAQLHGFEYLDRIRKVFVDENGQNENILPDDSQSKRITYLRVADRVVIRRLGFERITGLAPNTLVKGIYFDERINRDIIRGCNASLEYTGNSVKVIPVKDQYEHYDIHFVDKENGLLNTEDATHIRVKIRSLDGYSALRIPFLTNVDNRWNHKKISPNFYMNDTDGIVTYDFPASTLPTWNGIVTDLRVDNMNKVPFEIISIEFMKYVGEVPKVVNITSNGYPCKCEFDSYFKGDDVVVSFDPGLGIFRRLKLYHEYNELEKKLMIASRNHTVEYILDSDKAFADGKEVTLRVPMTMRDGLPTMSINELCDMLGYDYTVEDYEFKITC